MAIGNKISLAGDLGSGKSTVSKILIDRLGAQYYSTGSIVRSIADRMGMDVVTFNKYMETHPETDVEIDNGLRALSEDPRSLIIDSRMAWHFTEGTFKVYMSTDCEVSAARIMGAQRAEERFESLEEAVRSVRERRASEMKRYSEMYGVNIKDLTNYDLVVDTTYATPEEVAQVIISSFREWQERGEFKGALISPERLLITDREIDEDKLAEYADLAESDEELPLLDVREREGKFYVDDKHNELMLGISISFSRFALCRILPGAPADAEYVEMRNSL